MPMNRLRNWRRRGLAALCGGLAVAAAKDPAPPPAAPAGPKSHVLFMGTDLAVQRGTNFLRVRDVSGSSFMVKAGEEEVYVPMLMRSANLKIDHALKLAKTTIKLDRLRGDRTYTPANDPRLKAQRRSGAAAGAAAASDLNNFRIAELEIAVAASKADPSGPSARTQELERMLDGANEAQAELSSTTADFTSVGVHADRMQGDLADGNFDAMEVEFEVSSEVPLDNPYLVVISRFRERGTKPGLARNWIYAKSLEPIGPKPRYVRIREGGFPYGFILEDYQVHIYNRGEEVATNVSPKRVELTRDEALQYLLLQHLGTNKAASVPPKPVLGDLPPDLSARLGAGQYTQTYYVKVDKEGRPGGAFADAACTRRVEDPYLEPVFAGLRFLPALDKGKPIDGVCRVKLGNLRL